MNNKKDNQQINNELMLTRLQCWKITNSHILSKKMITNYYQYKEYMTVNNNKIIETNEYIIYECVLVQCYIVTNSREMI